MTDANAATPMVPLEGSYLESGSTSPVVPLEGYYFENGCTVLHDVALVERIYGTRRLIFLECDPGAVAAKLPAGWTVRSATFSNSNLVLSFNDWTIFSRGDNSPHDIKSPRFVGILAPVKNDSLRRSGFMQIYGLAADRKYVPGPYKEYRAALYSHTSNFTTDGLDVTWTHDDYRIKQADTVGEFNLTVSHRRTAVKRAIAQRPNVAVYSSSDPSIERFYQEDLVLDMPHTPAMTASNVKDFSLNCTIPHLSEVMAGAKLGGMIYNPNYLRDVYERIPKPAS